MILIISDPVADGHVPVVRQELARRGVETCVLDPGSLPTSGAFDLVLTSENTSASVSGSASGRGLALGTVTSVWYRKPSDFALDPLLGSAEARWLRNEWVHAVRGLWTLLDARWISDPAAIRHA